MSKFPVFPAKDPDSVEPYFFVWCSEDGLNDGSQSDYGELQGALIDTYSVVITPTGLTKDSDNKAAVTVHGTVYDANTVVTIWLSGGTDKKNYNILCQIVTDEDTPRTLQRTWTLPVREA